MIWVIFVAGAVLSWGTYGALLHMGQRQLGNPLKAMLCVGVAYFLIGVIIPVVSLGAQGRLSGFNTTGKLGLLRRRRSLECALRRIVNRATAPSTALRWSSIPDLDSPTNPLDGMPGLVAVNRVSERCLHPR